MIQSLDEKVAVRQLLLLRQKLVSWELFGPILSPGLYYSGCGNSWRMTRPATDWPQISVVHSIMYYSNSIVHKYQWPDQLLIDPPITDAPGNNQSQLTCPRHWQTNHYHLTTFWGLFGKTCWTDHINFWCLLHCTVEEVREEPLTAFKLGRKQVIRWPPDHGWGHLTFPAIHTASQH